MRCVKWIARFRKEVGEVQGTFGGISLPLGVHLQPSPRLLYGSVILSLAVELVKELHIFSISVFPKCNQNKHQNTAK